MPRRSILVVVSHLSFIIYHLTFLRRPEAGKIQMTTTKTKLMIVAGEPSGDAHAAKLVSALRALEPGR